MGGASRFARREAPASVLSAPLSLTVAALTRSRISFGSRHRFRADCEWNATPLFQSGPARLRSKCGRLGGGIPTTRPGSGVPGRGRRGPARAGPRLVYPAPATPTPRPRAAPAPARHPRHAPKRRPARVARPSPSCPCPNPHNSPNSLPQFDRVNNKVATSSFQTTVHKLDARRTTPRRLRTDNALTPCIRIDNTCRPLGFAAMRAHTPCAGVS
jgi:hypothetical protein